jgi:hypothetical protein
MLYRGKENVGSEFGESGELICSTYVLVHILGHTCRPKILSWAPLIDKCGTTTIRNLHNDDNNNNNTAFSMSSQSIPLPPNVHVSKHPCLQAKLSQLRSSSTSSRDVNRLIHEVALIVGCEALAGAVGLEGAGIVSHLCYYGERFLLF